MFFVFISSLSKGQCTITPERAAYRSGEELQAVEGGSFTQNRRKQHLW